MPKLTWTVVGLIAITVVSMSSVPAAADVIGFAISAQTHPPDPLLTMQGVWYWDRTNGSVGVYNIDVSGGSGYDPVRFEPFDSSAQVVPLTDCDNCACSQTFVFTLQSALPAGVQIQIDGKSDGTSCTYEGPQPANATANGQYFLTFDIGTVTAVPGAGAEAGIGLTASVNQPTFAVGQVLKTSATARVPGLRGSADLYVGVLLPDGDTIVFWTGAGRTALGRRADAQTFRPYASDVSLATPFLSYMPDFFVRQWTGAEPRGRYIFFHLATKAGSLAGGSAASHDVVLGLVTAPFSFP